MIADARDIQFQNVELFGKPALYTEQQVQRSSVPQGWFCYDCQGVIDTNKVSCMASGMQMGGM